MNRVRKLKLAKQNAGLQHKYLYNKVEDDVISSKDFITQPYLQGQKMLRINHYEFFLSLLKLRMLRRLEGTVDILYIGTQ